MPQIQDQQSPNINSTVDVPNIITSLNTNTGPEARPADFGADMSGVAQGLDSAYDNIYHAQREEQGKQAGKDELWAAQQHALLDQKYTGQLMSAEANNTPYKPEDFQTNFQTDSASVIAQAPTPGAAAAFNRGAVSMESDFFKQSAGLQMRQQMQARSTQVNDILNNALRKVSDGTMSPTDGLATVTAAGKLGLATNTPDAGQASSQTGAQIVQAGITRVAQTQGPGAASLAVRGGYGGAFISPVQRESLATNLDNTQAINQGARVAVAQQNVNALTQQAQAGGTVSPAAAHAASTELANAQSATPVQTNPPDLADFLQQRADYYDNLVSQAKGPFDHQVIDTYRKIEQADLIKLGTDRLNVLSPNDQRVQIDKLASTLEGGADNGIVQHLAAIAQNNIARLTPGEKYDPAGVAMQNPGVQAAMEQSTKAQPLTPGDEGQTEGAMKIAMEKNFAAQRLLGVQPGQEQVLTKQQATEYGYQANNPQDAQNLVNKFQQQYGPDYGNKALTQVFTSKGQMSGSVSLALMNPNSQPLWAAAQFKPEGKMSDGDAATITSALKSGGNKLTALMSGPSNSTWNNYWAAQKNDLSSAQRRATMEQAMPGMAEYFMKQDNMTAGEAINHVVDLSIGQAYAIAPTGGGTSAGGQLAVPVGIASDAATVAQHQVKANILMNGLIRTNGIQNNGDVGQVEFLATQAVSNGYWAFDNANQSYTRMYDTANGPTKVILGNGQPLQLNAKMVRDTNIVTTNQPPSSIARTPGVINDLKTGFDFLRGVTAPVGASARWGNTTQAIPGDPNSYLVPSTPRPDNSPILHSNVPVAPIANPQEFKNATGDAPPVNTTHYGYSDDRTPDRNSTNGTGAFGDNPLTPGAVALSPSAEKRYNAQPGDVIEMKDAQGNIRRGYFADRTSPSLQDDRVDLYDPHGSEASGAPFKAVSMRNLGGGHPKLAGRRLSAVGEMNIAQLEASNG